MTDLALSIYNWLYHDLSLRGTGLFLGVLMLVIHVGAILNAKPLMAWLKTVPRHRMTGIVILSIDLIWALVLITAMDLGEFHTLRSKVQFLLPVSFVLTILYVDEFLAARAFGILLILAACPVIDAAFLETPLTRLLLPVLAYAWIILGMFWVGMPYLMRDHIAWVSASEGRWKKLAAGGAAYGLAMLLCAVMLWK